MKHSTQHDEAVRLAARPHVVVATLIGLLPRLGCRLRAVEDFGMTVRFTGADHSETAPRVLVARVHPEDETSVLAVRPVEAAGPDDDRVHRTITSVLAEVASRLRD